MAEKKQCRMEDWQIIDYRLHGKIYDHPHFPDGKQVRTSIILSAPDEADRNGYIETRNTIYKLGKKFIPQEEK